MADIRLVLKSFSIDPIVASGSSARVCFERITNNVFRATESIG
jgi:hypothetical protein